MPAEGEGSSAPKAAVPLVPVDIDSPLDDGSSSVAGPRRRWWFVVAVVVVLGAAAAAVGLRTGEEPSADGEPATDSEPAVLSEPAATDDAAPDVESAIGDTQPEDGSQRVFGEPEHPVSGVEPYIASEAQVEGTGQSVDVCLGMDRSRRSRLPLQFASTLPVGVDQLSWSPGCARMVFRVGGTLLVADGDGTNDQPFLTARYGLSGPAWSPDGVWIAFARNAIVDGERASHIYLVKPDARSLSPFTEGLVLDQDPAWSSDGERIVFSRRVHVVDGDGGAAGKFDQYLVVIDQITGATKTLLAGGEHESDPSWSPDGEFIAYRVGDAAKLLRVADGTVSEFLGAGVGGKLIWSPDGTRLAAWREWTADGATIIIGEVSEEASDDPLVIDLADIEQASPTVMPTLRWSADGQRLVFVLSDAPDSYWVHSLAVPKSRSSP